MIYVCRHRQYNDLRCKKCWLNYGVEHQHHKIIERHHFHLTNIYIAYSSTDQSEPCPTTRPKCPVVNENPQVRKLDHEIQRDTDD